MSRSIHVTRRAVQVLRRMDFRDDDEHEARVQAAEDRLWNKRRIKQAVREERRASRERADGAMPANVAQIPIIVRDAGPHVQYPCGEADLRAVMPRLPMGTLDGVRGIVLCLGTEYQAEADEAEQCTPDPYSGRPGITCLLNVYTGPVLGTYFAHSATIDLYAYVYDAAAMPDREVRELYLRLNMLGTFFHEVAHHDDAICRVGRGRWRAEAGDGSEEYAEGQGTAWLRDIGVQYLQETYPDAVSALFDWTAHWGGVGVTLSLIAQTEHQVLFSVADAFEQLFSDVDAGEPVRATRLTFSRGLRYAVRYAEALDAVGAVLAVDPEDAEAIAVQSAIFERQGKDPLAEERARVALALDEECVEAWWTLVRVYRHRQDWPLLERATSRVLELEPDDPSWVFAVHDRARARIELSEFEGALADIERLAQAKSRSRRPEAEVLRALLHLRRHEYEIALGVVERLVATSPKGALLPPALPAIRFEAARALGRDTKGLELSAADLARLRRSGESAWAERLSQRSQ